MKILLLGEYSRLHNTLKEGLLALGHEVVLVGSGDNFKKFPSDIDISSYFEKYWLTKKTGVLIYKLFAYDIFKKHRFIILNNYVSNLKNFDVVQLINEDSFGLYPSDTKQIYKKIFNHNSNVFLSGCGEDFHVINFYNQKKMRYSILTPFFENNNLKNDFQFSFKYLTKDFKDLHHFIHKNIKAVIPSDIDYAIPYKGFDKAVQMIPNPVNVDKISYQELKIDDKINIFFGINTWSFYKKGSHIILEVLKKIKTNFSSRVEIVLAENLPYNEYIQKYNNAHIFIDQLFSYDQGFNALEAMAKGKCVITGAEKEFVEYYHLDKLVAVNSLPNTKSLYDILSDLILHKQKIIEIGKNARFFIENKHHYKTVAQQYVDIWTKKTSSPNQ